jgi:16S rRNA (guanine966-N2)-methyltransferase
MSVRIIGGDSAGRRIETPNTLDVRPLSARAKRVLFDILGDSLEGMKVADLFAGVGSFSFECLSRGAVEATAVEKNSILVDYIYKNAKRLGFSDVVRVYEGDVLEYLTDVQPEKPYDLIFVDPPYRSGLTVPTIASAVGWSGISARSFIVTRVFKKEVVEPPRGLSVVEERIIGDDKLTFLKRNPGGNR